MEDHALRNSSKAVELAQQITFVQPNIAAFQNTLGVAFYRERQFEDAIVALTKSDDLAQGAHGALDWLFLAMAERQLGNRTAAMGWFQKLESWRQENPHFSTSEFERLFQEEREAMR